MPIYEYECEDCGSIEEAFQKISEEPLIVCKKCQGHLNKLISQSSFQLKGSGWYVTDYGGSSGKGGSSAKEKKALAPKESSVKKSDNSGAALKKKE
ncbi:MAG: zinc ribbon domain-containing protein [Thermodesulfobacteriota bacterium]|nr:zinc ribbon domain-containing protein [Thermodesulfobacteriota bacterium]